MIKTGKYVVSRFTLQRPATETAPGQWPTKGGRALNKSDDLTISEVLRDPLIATVMRADGVQFEEFKRLLETAARKRESGLSNFIKRIAKWATRTPASHQREDTQHVSRLGTEDA